MHPILFILVFFLHLPHSNNFIHKFPSQLQRIAAKAKSTHICNFKIQKREAGYSRKVQHFLESWHCFLSLMIASRCYSIISGSLIFTWQKWVWYQKAKDLPGRFCHFGSHYKSPGSSLALPYYVSDPTAWCFSVHNEALKNHQVWHWISKLQHDS